MKNIGLGVISAAVMLAASTAGVINSEEGTALRAKNIGETEIIDGESYILTFYDDFDSDELNTANWEYCPEWERADRGGRWSGDMVSVSDGVLKLTTSFDEKENRCKSGAIRSKGLFEQADGYFEASMKLQQAPGFWSAFWLMTPEQGKIGNGGRDGCEIDIMEAYSYKDKMINHALHWDGYGEHHQSSGKNEQLDIYDGEFHTFALKWTKERYYFYVDDELMWDTDDGGVSEVKTYLKLTLEVGSWAGEIDKSSLPSGIEVDYIRVYQFENE